MKKGGKSSIKFREVMTAITAVSGWSKTETYLAEWREGLVAAENDGSFPKRGILTTSRKREKNSSGQIVDGIGDG